MTKGEDMTWQEMLKESERFANTSSLFLSYVTEDYRGSLNSQHALAVSEAAKAAAQLAEYWFERARYHRAV